MLKPKENERNKSISIPCTSKRIFQAISILKQLNQKFCENKEKKSLLDDESENPIILQLTMKKIPPPYMQKFIKVRLPKCTLNDKKEVCLITGDLDKRNTKAEVEPDVLHFKELLKKENISQVNEVITLRQLRKEYKPYEARRQLCGAYDVFLCDRKIAGVLPSTLGKSFFKKRKFPIQINMETPNLKQQIENALSSTVFHITCKGNSCASEVADFSMKNEDILLNILSSIEALKEQLPGQWDNVLGIYVKTPKSKAIPLFMSNDDPNEFKFTQKRPRPEPVTGKLSTFDDKDVKVFRDGRVFVKGKKFKGEDLETLSDLSEGNSSDDEMNEDEPASDDEALSNANDAEMLRKYEKKSKKQHTNSDSNEESFEDEIKEEITEDPEVQIPKKKNKKQKPNSKSNVESDKVDDELKEKIIEEIPKKKNKKQKPNSKLNAESDEVEVIFNDPEIVKKDKKKSKKHQTNLDAYKESFEDEIEEITNASEVQIPKKKNKKQKSHSNFSIESNEIEVAVNDTERVKKHRKKSKKLQTNSDFNNESFEDEVKVEATEERPKKINKKQKPNSEFNVKSIEVEEVEGNIKDSTVKIKKSKSKKRKNCD